MRGISYLKQNMTTYPGNASVTIHDLNNEEVMRRLPSLIYIAILILVGFPGNLSVLVVFLKHYKRSTYRTFIVALASVDTVACSVCMPFEIIETRFQYTFHVVEMCKIFRTVAVVISLTSIFILVGLSADRYRRLCRPLKIQMSVKVSKLVCFASVPLAVSLAWSHFLLSGIRHVNLRNNITGVDCSLSDEYKSTKYSFYHNAVLFAIFIISICSLIAMYILIGRKIFQHVRIRETFRPTFSSTTRNKTSSIFHAESIEEAKSPEPTSPSQQPTFTSIAHKRNSTLVGNHSDNSKTKITRVAFAVSVLFVVSYLPHLILATLTAVKGSFVAAHGPVVSAVLPIVSRSTFINSVGNPFIYGIIDHRFRRAVKQMFCSGR